MPSSNANLFFPCHTSSSGGKSSCETQSADACFFCVPVPPSSRTGHQGHSTPLRSTVHSHTSVVVDQVVMEALLTICQFLGVFRTLRNVKYRELVHRRISSLNCLSTQSSCGSCSLFFSVQVVDFVFQIAQHVRQNVFAHFLFQQIFHPETSNRL